MHGDYISQEEQNEKQKSVRGPANWFVFLYKAHGRFEFTKSGWVCRNEKTARISQRFLREKDFAFFQ